jgi:hypothetical protein
MVRMRPSHRDATLAAAIADNADRADTRALCTNGLDMTAPQPVLPKPISQQAYISFGLPLGFAVVVNLLTAWIFQGDNLGHAYILIFLGPIVAGVFLLATLIYSAVTRTLRAWLGGWAIALLITMFTWL